MSHYRSVVRTERFNDEFSEIEPDIRKQEYFIRRLEWTIVRNPKAGFKDVIPNLYGIYFRHRRFDVVVYYSFSDTQIFLESIRLDIDDEIERYFSS